MTECLNEEMRDLLPPLAHGSLGVAEADRVRAHAAGCATCGAELAVLETSRLVLQASAPRVDVVAIARAVSREVNREVNGEVAVSMPDLRLERGAAKGTSTARASIWRSRQLLAAAASLLIVTSLSLRLLSRAPTTDEGAAAPDTSALVSTAPAPTNTAAGGELSVGDALVDLTSDDLATLLAELDLFDGKITLEPASMRQPIVDSPETR